MHKKSGAYKVTTPSRLILEVDALTHTWDGLTGARPYKTEPTTAQTIINILPSPFQVRGNERADRLAGTKVVTISLQLR